MPTPPGWRVPPPAPDALVRWPDTFGDRFLVTVDTEEEFDWSAPLSRDNRAVTAVAALPAAHRRFAERAVAMTYLVDHPIATDPAAVDALRAVLADPRAEVGTQLHPWVNPPFRGVATPASSYAGNLPPDLEAAKLEVLTAIIADTFDRQPRIYRAGRYGIGPHSHALLARLGYRLDSSIRSRYDYRAGGGPDFRRVGPHAFRCGPDGLIELPLTTSFIGPARAGGARLHGLLGRVPKAQSGFARLGLLQRVALTPEEMPLRHALEAIRVALGEGVRLLTFAFHSPTLVPGHTPYVRDQDDLRAFWRWWDGVFDLLDRHGARSATLDELLAAAG